MDESKIVEIVALDWPKIDQLRLIIVLGYLLLLAWLIALWMSINQPVGNEELWCAEWNKHTVESEWVYEPGIGCIKQRESYE